MVRNGDSFWMDGRIEVVRRKSRRKLWIVFQWWSDTVDNEEYGGYISLLVREDVGGGCSCPTREAPKLDWKNFLESFSTQNT